MTYNDTDPLQDILPLFGMEPHPRPLVHEERPEWYPTEDIFINEAWGRFAVSGSDVDAMVAIEVIMNEGLSLPPELRPWVCKAVSAWNDSNKQRSSTGETSRKWEELVRSVYLTWLTGKTVTEAVAEALIDAHAVGWFVSDKSLHTEYKRSKHKEMKEGLFIGMVAEYVSLKGNEEALLSFEQKWPRFITML